MHSQSLLRYFRFKTLLKLVSCALLVMLADFFFYDQFADGWILGGFGLAWLAAIMLHRPGSRHERAFRLACAASAGLALSMVEMPSTLSFLLFLLTIGATTLLHKHVRDNSL